MSVLESIDLLTRGGVLSLLALWSWLLVRDKWDAPAARIAVAMNAAIACHVILTILNADYPIIIDAPLSIGAGLVAVLFWLFARAWFDDRPDIGWLGWAGLVLSGLLVAINQFGLPIPRALGEFSFAMFRIMLAVFAIAGTLLALRGRDNDLVEARRRLRLRLVVAIGLFIMLTNFIEMAVYGRHIDTGWRSLIEFGILILAFGFCGTMFGIRQADLLGPPEHRSTNEAKVALEPNPLAITIGQAMRDERLYRDEKLTISALAATLDEQEYRIRRTINGTLGHRNFARFVNSYRLEEVKAALADQSQREVPILTIALDAGFGSLGPFNRAFRDVEGMTPTEYRKTKLADSEIG